jgi:hypothetical protein
MTLANYRLHGTNIEYSTNKSTNVISVLKFIPEELDKVLLKSEEFPQISQEGMLQHAIEQQIVVSPPVETNLPNTTIDSRSLIENQIITQLNLEAQQSVRKELNTMINEAIGESRRVQYDRKRSIYNQGVQEALITAQKDLEINDCLYGLAEKYCKISQTFLNIIENEIDIDELDFPQTRHKGTASAYINLVTIFKEKLTLKENVEHRIENLQPIR